MLRPVPSVLVATSVAVLGLWTIGWLWAVLVPLRVPDGLGGSIWCGSNLFPSNEAIAEDSGPCEDLVERYFQGVATGWVLALLIPL